MPRLKGEEKEREREREELREGEGEEVKGKKREEEEKKMDQHPIVHLLLSIFLSHSIRYTSSLHKYTKNERDYA